MAKDDDSNGQDEQNKGEGEDRDRSRDDGGSEDDDGDAGAQLGGRDLAWRAYLKLAATILLTLIVFTLILSGWTSCQGMSPITGTPTAP